MATTYTARLGAYAANARRDTHAHAAKMRRAQRDAYRQGHGCPLCGPRYDIPTNVTERDRDQRADRLWRAHWERMRHASTASTQRKIAARRAATRQDAPR